jgi:hypothetical protein
MGRSSASPFTTMGLINTQNGKIKEANKTWVSNGSNRFFSESRGCFMLRSLRRRAAPAPWRHF